MGAGHPECSDAVRDPDLLAKLEHPIEYAIDAATIEAEIAAYALHLVFDRTAVERQHVRHDHPVGEAVVAVEDRANRM